MKTRGQRPKVEKDTKSIREKAEPISETDATIGQNS